MSEQSTRIHHVTIQTAGACLGNPGQGGYAAILTYGEHSKEVAGGFRRTTAFRMELTAVVKGLEALKARCTVTIQSDSKYLVEVESQQRARDWRERGWRGRKNESIANVDLWSRVLELCERHEVHFVWVNVNVGENEKAAGLADRAARQPNLGADLAYELQETTLQTTLSKLFTLPDAISPGTDPGLHETIDEASIGVADEPHDDIDDSDQDTETGVSEAVLCESLAYEGRTYTWSGTCWLDSDSIAVPAVVESALNALYEQDMSAADASEGDIDVLLERARHARRANQLQRAERLTRRVLEGSPGHPGALAILCAILRRRGRPKQALEETESASHASYPPLIVSRAAAQCDLGRWEEAKRTISRALAIGGGGEAFAVVRRIKSIRPDLYDRDLKTGIPEAGTTAKPTERPRDSHDLITQLMEGEAASALREEGLLLHSTENGASYILRPDGDIFKFTVVRDKLERLAALVAGSEEFPELRQFLPERDGSCPDWPTCDGIAEPAPSSLSICGQCETCGGLGWIP